MHPLLLRLAKRLIRLARYNSSMWSGDYPDWASAMRQCTGYQADNILDRCRAALREVLAGRAAYERDSLLFNDDRYCWELMTVAYQTAARNQGRLSVLDFGGSLGSLYFQHRRWLADIPSVQWHVVEQPHFVDCGRAEAEDTSLRFFHTIEESMAASQPNVLLLSGVLQALERPYDSLLYPLRPALPVPRSAATGVAPNTLQSIPPAHRVPRRFHLPLPDGTS